VQKVRNLSKSPKRNRSSLKNKSPKGQQLGEHAPSKVQEAFQHRKQFATEGNLNFRMFAFVGGLAVIFTSIESLSIVIIEREFLNIFIYLTNLFFGIIICILEAHFLQFDRVQDTRRKIVELVPILKYLYGRGIFYIFSGTIQLSELSPTNIFSGLFLVGVGILFLTIGWSTKKRFKKLKKVLKDPNALKKYFRKFDRDGDNVLDRDEFGALIVGLTAEEMDEDELEGAFAVMDVEGKGYVTLEELITWWQGFDDRSVEEETGGYDMM